MITAWKRFLILAIVTSILGTILYFVIKFNNRLYSIYSSITTWRNIFDVVQTPTNLHDISRESVHINNDGTITVNCSAIRKDDVLLNKADPSHVLVAGNFLQIKDAKIQYAIMLIHTILRDISSKIESGDDFTSDLEMAKTLSSSIPNLELLLLRIHVPKVKTKADIKAKFVVLKNKIDSCIYDGKYKNRFIAKTIFWFKKIFSVTSLDDIDNDLNYDNMISGMIDLNCRDDKILELKKDISDIIALNLVMSEAKQLTDVLLLNQYNALRTSE